MSKSKSNEIIVIGKMDHTLDNTLESANRVYSKDGICPTIPTCAGGNIQPKIIDELKTIVAMRGRNPEKPECINLHDEQGKRTSFQDRVYKTDKISPAITTSFRPNYAVEHNDTDSEKIKIKQATKQGYIECKAGGVADFSYPESKLRRGWVQRGGDVSPTLTSSNLGVCKVESRYRIRKLTPKECWRLMGFSDEDFEKAAKVNSNTQLYKQAGNSIVKDVLMAIFRQMID